MSILDTLITTHQDGQPYGVDDLNRVGEAINYLADWLGGLGYSVTVSPKTDWAVNDIQRKAQMEQYLNDVQSIRSALAVFASTPPTPGDMDDLNAQKANAIEQILLDVEKLITNMSAAFRHSGTTACGQGGLIL